MFHIKIFLRRVEILSKEQEEKRRKIAANDEYYIDDVGGIHMPGDCYNPKGRWCGDCTKLSCRNCPYRNLEEVGFKEEEFFK